MRVKWKCCGSSVACTNSTCQQHEVDIKGYSSSTSIKNGAHDLEDKGRSFSHELVMLPPRKTMILVSFPLPFKNGFIGNTDNSIANSPSQSIMNKYSHLFQRSWPGLPWCNISLSKARCFSASCTKRSILESDIAASPPSTNLKRSIWNQIFLRHHCRISGARSISESDIAALPLMKSICLDIINIRLLFDIFLLLPFQKASQWAFHFFLVIITVRMRLSYAFKISKEQPRPMTTSPTRGISPAVYYAYLKSEVFVNVEGRYFPHLVQEG